MKYIAWLSGVVLLWSATLVWGKDLTVVTLVEGENCISVSLANTGKRDLNSISANVEKSNLPQWIRLRGVSGNVTAYKGRKSEEKLRIHLTVKGAQSGAEAEIPVTLKDQSGCEWTYTFLAKVSGSAPTRDILFENYPNPFNPSTSISFSLKESRPTTLVIYNTLGQKIRTLLNQSQSMGKHTIQWNGKDDAGRMVSSGTYFYRLTSGSFVQTRRMLLVE